MWMNPSNPVFHNGSQVAEVLKIGADYTIRNLRPNGNVGVCFQSKNLADIRPWLDSNYPGWKKEI
jgi:hypothetical protein